MYLHNLSIHYLTDVCSKLLLHLRTAMTTASDTNKSSQCDTQQKRR